jgi:3-oxoacyl-[acyl-carrier protein] reductase
MPDVVLITGTRKGIGRYLVDHYLAKGCVVAGCSRDPFDEPLPANYCHYTADVTDERAMVDMVRDIQQRFGGVTALINNAGIAAMNHLLLTPLSTVQRIFATNVFGTFVATVATPLNLEGEAVYAASKAAVESLTRVAARELAPFNITVNAVGPTPVMTDLIRTVPKQKMDALIGSQAIRRIGEHRDIANVTDFLVSRDSDFITGQTIYLGGIN